MKGVRLQHQIQGKCRQGQYDDNIMFSFEYTLNKLKVLL